MTNSERNNSKAKDIGTYALGSAGGMPTSSAVVESPKESPLKGFLADPIYSGLGTWLGTLLSIGAAYVAFKQARKAMSAVARIKVEQKRQYVEMVHRSISRLDQTVKPIVINGIPARGFNVKPTVDAAIEICHQLLSAPIGKSLPSVPEAITDIENNLRLMDATVEAAKASKITSQLVELQLLIRTKIQLISRLCIEYLDSNATNAN